MFKVVICGGRKYANRHRVRSLLEHLLSSDASDTVAIIHGGAQGADSLAGSEARNLGIPEIVVPANWSKFSFSAGPIRNRTMVRLDPDLVIALPGGKGTADMVKQASYAGLWVVELRDRDDIGQVLRLL